MDKSTCKESIRLMHDRYEYWDRVPQSGLSIGNRPAITQIDPSLIGDYMIMTVRDPLAAYDKDPVDFVADHLSSVVQAGKSGMFAVKTGTYKGARISVCSGGSGCPEVELAMNDFLEYTNCSTYIRMGTSGGVGDNVQAGDCVVSSGILREDGTSRAYIDDGFPAYCHYEVVTAMVTAAERLGYPWHLGITACMDSDFVGNGRPSVRGYLQPRNIEKLGIYNRAGVLNTDRESSIIVTMCNLFGKRGGAVFNVTDNLIIRDKFVEGLATQNSLDITLEGIAVLHEIDTAKKKSNQKYLTYNTRDLECNS